MIPYGVNHPHYSYKWQELHFSPDSVIYSIRKITVKIVKSNIFCPLQSSISSQGKWIHFYFPSEKGSFLKGKHFLTFGASSFVLELKLFRRGSMCRTQEEIITKTRLFKYIENFNFKNWKISDKNLLLYYFLILAQNIDCFRVDTF